MLVATEMPKWKLDGGGPEAYEQYIVPAWMGEWADALVRAAGVGQARHVLDVACGTGIVARKAAPLVGTGGNVIGTDSSKEMLDAARHYANQEGIQNVEWHLCDASRMPFSDTQFDVTLCQQGLQFFPDRIAALREMARVTATGGRVAISVWRSIERCPLLKVLADVIGEYLGTASTVLLHASCSLPGREELRMLLTNAGLRDIHIRLEVKISRYPSFAEFLPGYLSVFPINNEIAALGETTRTEMFSRISNFMSDFTDDDGFAVPMECHVLTAVK